MSGMRELLRAVMKGKPIITILEPEKKHGGITYADVVEQLHQAMSSLDTWGLTAEVVQWQDDEGLKERPTADELANALFNTEVLEWNRIGVSKT